MNILMTKFPYSSLYGGGELHTVTLIDQLLRRGHGVLTLTSCPVLLKEMQTREWMVRKWSIGRDPVSKGSLLTWPLRAPWAAASLWGALIWYRLRHKTRALYCLSLQDKVLATPIARLLGMKVIWMEHTQIENWLRKNPLRLFYILWARLATIVVPAKAIKEQVVQLGVPARRVKKIVHWADPEIFKPVPSDPERVKQLYRIGYVGRLAKEKGIEYLLKAVANFKDVIPYTVHIVGDGPAREELEWLAEKLGIADRVRFLGFQTRVDEHYASMDVVVLPSTRLETFGIVLVEAMLSEKPVMASNVGGVPEVIGDCGILVEPKNVDVLTNKLLQIYHHYPEALGMARRGRQRALEHFNLDRMVDAFETLFTQ